MNKSLKSSLKSYDREIDTSTRSLYHTTIGIFMTRDPGDVSLDVWMDTVTSNNTRQLFIISAWFTSVGWDHIGTILHNHSTIHPIIHFLNYCAEANNKLNSEFVLAVFCDLSKAFDVINHDILLHKLNLYGIRGIVNDWFRDYLSNRIQYVQFENKIHPYWVYFAECHRVRF